MRGVLLRGVFLLELMFCGVGRPLRAELPESEQLSSAGAGSRNDAHASACEDSSDILSPISYSRHPWLQLRGHGELLWLRLRLRQEKDWSELAESRAKEQARDDQEEAHLTAEREGLRYVAFQIYGNSIGSAKKELLDLIDRGRLIGSSGDPGSDLAPAPPSKLDPATLALLRYLHLDLQCEQFRIAREARERFESTQTLRVARLRLRALRLENALKLIPNEGRERAILRAQEKVVREQNRLDLLNESDVREQDLRHSGFELREGEGLVAPTFDREAQLNARQARLKFRIAFIDQTLQRSSF